MASTASVNAIHPNDNNESLNIGGEYGFHESVFLRAGYKALGLSESEEGLGVGIGIRHQFSEDFTLTMDYAYQDFGILDFTQHFSVGVRF